MQEDSFTRSSPGFLLLGQGPENSSHQPLRSLKAQRKWKETWHTVGTKELLPSQALWSTQCPTCLPQCFQSSLPRHAVALILHPYFTDKERSETTCPRSQSSPGMGQVLGHFLRLRDCALFPGQVLRVRARAVVLNWGNFTPQGTFGNV